LPGKSLERKIPEAAKPGMEACAVDIPGEIAKTPTIAGGVVAVFATFLLIKKQNA